MSVLHLLRRGSFALLLVSAAGCMMPNIMATPNDPGIALESRIADSTFQTRTMRGAVTYTYQTRPLGSGAQFQNTQNFAFTLYTKVFEHGGKLAWCGGYSFDNTDTNVRETVRNSITWPASYMQVDAPDPHTKPRIWTGPFALNEATRAESTATNCAVTTVPWQAVYEQARVSFYIYRL